MARRKQLLVADILDVTSKLPWWVGIVLAAGSYGLLHITASMTITPASDLKEFGSAAGRQMVKGLASVFQYILPVLFLLGSLMSVLGRRKRRSLHAAVAASDEALSSMTWADFELLVGEFFRHRGFAVTEMGGASADGGVDLIVSAGKDRYLVQCKKWRANQVGVATVRELYGVMAATGAAGAFVVTSGSFTKEAKRFAEGREIKLIPAHDFLKEVRKDQVDEPLAAATPTQEEKPACPQCGKPMVLRTAGTGTQAGKEFWGCSGFPNCRGTRAVTLR